MKTKLLFLITFLAMAGGGLLGQSQQSSYSNPVGGNITASGANCANAGVCVWQKLPATATTTTVTITGTFSETLIIETSADGGNTFTQQSSQIAPIVVTFTSTSFTDVRVRSSAFTSGNAGVNIQTAGNQQNITINSGSSSGGGGLPQIINAASQGVKGDAKWVCNATFANGSPTVTTPAGDPPFQASDVGKIMWGSNALCGGTQQATITTRIAQGTITGFTDAHTVTVSNNSSAACTPVNGDGCTFVWGAAGGVDDTTTLNAAFQATINQCNNATLQLSGWSIISAPITTTTVPCSLAAGGNGASFGYTVMGTGEWSSGVIHAPSYTAASCPANEGCDFSAVLGNPTTSNRFYHDFGMAAFTSAPAGSASKIGLFAGFSSDVYNILMLDFWPSASNAFTALQAIGCLNCYLNIHNNQILNSGQQPVFISNGARFYNNWTQGASGGVNFGGANPNWSWGNVYGFPVSNQPVLVNGSSTLYSDSDFCNAQAVSPCIEVGGSASFFASGLTATNNTGTAVQCDTGTVCQFSGKQNRITATGTHIALAGNGTAKISLANTTLSGTGSNCVNMAATSTFINLGGNSCAAGTAVFSGTAYGAAPSESGSAACTASTATITFNGVYLNNPNIGISDTTTSGGARISAKTLTTATVTCTGATDAFDYSVTPNPI